LVIAKCQNYIEEAVQEYASFGVLGIKSAVTENHFQSSHS